MDYTTCFILFLLLNVVSYFFSLFDVNVVQPDKIYANRTVLCWSGMADT